MFNPIRYTLEEEALRPYFALPNVLEVGGRVLDAGRCLHAGAAARCCLHELRCILC